MLRRTEDDGILCLGRVYCDVILSGLTRMPTAGTEIFANGAELHAGGGAFITAAYLTALGRQASLSAWLPAAPFDVIVTEDIVEAQIDSSACKPAPRGAEPQLTVALVDPSDRAFVTRRSGAAVPPLSVKELSHRRIRHMHIGELATLVERPELLDVARAAGVTVSLDCGWDETLTAGQIADLIAQVDVFLPNQAEAEWLQSIGLTAPFAPLTVEKRGAEGSRAWSAEGMVEAPARKISLVDTTGAGDAFNAGFIDRWLEEADLQECLVAGNRCGAVAATSVGGFDARHAATLLVPARRQPLRT